MKTFVSAKIQNLRVTRKSVDYHGSVGIDARLLIQSGISPYEQVHIVNLRNGERWVTYAIPDRPGEFALNGGSARLGDVGDRCLVIAYCLSDRPFQAAVLFCDGESNEVADMVEYDVLPDWDGNLTDAREVGAIPRELL